ncbi:hypothetical protein CASFOL_022825 [Castilleja foliolosa]|uniref:G3BP-like protein n=1 Tax=Castilleja foliolosa TaxID=1961234 RepID=A0ABD3CTI5_9LAMI
MSAAAEPVTAQVVGNAFVQQYYHILHHSPGLVHRFYQDISKLGRPNEDGSLSTTTTMQDIDAKIVALNYGDFKAEIKSVDAQESFNGGVDVLVTGYLTEKDHTVRTFAQSFFLAPQDKGYFVLNDIFRYVDSAPTVNPALVAEVAVPNVVVPVTDEPVAAPIQENHVSEQSMPSAEEPITGEVYNPPENEDVPVVIEEELPVAEVVDEVQDDTQKIVESNAKIEEVPKKSYASIVKHIRESGAILSPPTPPKKAPPKKIEQLKPTFSPATDGPVSNPEPLDNGNNQDGEGDGYSIYIKGLPMSATDSVLEEVFKKFGTIKNDGIQVRSNKQQGFCFGFVEFEEASSVQKALEASPVVIGGRPAFVEEKRSTNSRGNNRSRFQSGRGSGFRNEGVRGRGGNNYGGGRGYNNNNRGDFNGGRSEFGNNRGSNNRNRDGYPRSDNGNGNGIGGRTIRNGGMANGNGAKNTTPRDSAIA